MKEKEIDIIIIDGDDKKYMMQIPKKISYKKLIDRITDIFEKYYFDIFYNSKLYTNKNINDIIIFEQGDSIKLIKTRLEEKFIFCNFHEDARLDEEDMFTEQLTGILNLCLLKYISKNFTNIDRIEYIKIKNIISELRNGIEFKEFKDNPEENIKANLSQNSGNNILSYINYIDSIIKEKEINYLINKFDNIKQKEIKGYWSKLSKYQTFNKLFEKDFLKAIEKSYFDYSLIGISIYQQKRRKEFVDNSSNCNKAVVKYLFHGTQIDPISKILTGGFKYTKKPFYGMGIYFSDMLDYVSFYSGGKDFDNRRENFGLTLPINSTFSCIAAEVYYSQDLIREIFDFNLFVDELNDFPSYEEIKKNYKDKMVVKNGVHFIRVEPEQGQVKEKEEINTDRKKGKFIGTEYVITEMDQILPLYGLTLKRNEYFVIWRDPNFKGENEFSEYLYERKMFMYQYAKMNAYFESSTEKALEIIKRKKFNKMILISSIGLDLSGKKFVETARKILGFDIVVLFFSRNEDHLTWIQNFHNTLYTNDANYYQDYILHYNELGLFNLKSEIEQNYNINLKFTNDFLKFPKFINEAEYNNLIFNEISDNFKKVIIKSYSNNYLLKVDGNRKVFLEENINKEIDPFFWYVTIIDDEITFYSNESYLSVNKDGKTINGYEFMIRWKFELIEKDKYIFYYKNEYNALTENKNNVILCQKDLKNNRQYFILIDLNFD